MDINITLDSFWLIFGLMVIVGFIMYRDLS